MKAIDLEKAAQLVAGYFNKIADGNAPDATRVYALRDLCVSELEEMAYEQDDGKAGEKKP